MLVVGESVDRWHAGELREFLDVLLGVRANDRTVNHPAENARGVLDRFTAADLNIAGAEKHHLAAQFADADLEGHARACGRFVEDQRPRLAGQWKFPVPAAFPFHGACRGQDLVHVRSRQFFQIQQVFHTQIPQSGFATTDSMILSPSSASLCLRFSGGNRRMTWLPAGMVNSPASCRRFTNWTDGALPLLANTALSAASSTPISRPIPRTPRITRGCFCANRARPVFKNSPITRALSASFSRWMTSSTRSATAQASGVPPKVVACVPGPSKS